ncbi:hypothetical protein PRUPE_8G060800 [Prunus persica]|uniref:non-specific serine/threonine protein kinase n=1 Tax=Prunus persica TaxID=3760 RepID=A0A251MTY4_PRUPE|nr:hypothetical protein PRUPE_8G060800 [Prunus persica]
MIALTQTIKQHGFACSKLGIFLEASHLEEVEELPHGQIQLEEAAQIFKADDRPINIRSTLARGTFHGAEHLPEKFRQQKRETQREIEGAERDNPGTWIVRIHTRYTVRRGLCQLDMHILGYSEVEKGTPRFELGFGGDTVQIGHKLLFGNLRTAPQYKGTFGWSKSVNIVKGVAHALLYMHHDCLPPIVHRDISSNNILLDSEYEACVSDFGTAKFLNPDSANWTAVADTYGYVGLELAYKMEVNAQCNVYSFGVVTLEIIMGRHPGNFFSSLSSRSSSSSSSGLPAHQMPIVDVVDQRISPPTNQEAGEVVSLVKIAFACLNPSPQSRPTMKQVSQRLSTERSLLLEPLHMITWGELLALNGFAT